MVQPAFFPPEGQLLMSVYVWPALLFTWLFCMGATIGSFLNVCIGRLPTGRTPCWPPSTCFSCFQPIAMRDNLPLLSYWLLHGRCRRCGSSFSMRYFWIEFFVGSLFAGYYFLEIGANVHDFQIFGGSGFWYLQAALFPPWSWTVFIIHALMLAFLVTAAMIQWERGRPERSVLVRGCVVGLTVGVLFPWPFPYDWRQVVTPADQPAATGAEADDESWVLRTPHPGPMAENSPWWNSFYSPRLGFTPWPAFGPLPTWLAGPLLGLITSLTGCALGLALRWICCGRFLGEASGTGPESFYDDGGVLALAGSFLGWQPVLAGAVLAFAVALAWRLSGRRGNGAFSLVAGFAVVACWLGWTWLTPLLAPACFSLPRSAIALAIAGGLAFWLRTLGRIAPVEEFPVT